MVQYINKDALVAEMERLAEVKPIDEFQPQVQNKIDWLSGKLFAINSLRVFLDTLEVKEVDLEQISKHYALNNSPWDDCWPETQDAFKAGFELGLKTQKGE